jgi:hypothetical protein
LSSAGWRKTAASCSTRSGGESRQRQPREFKAPASSKEGIQNGSDDESRNPGSRQTSRPLKVNEGFQPPKRPTLGDWNETTEDHVTDAWEQDPKTGEYRDCWQFNNSVVMRELGTAGDDDGLFTFVTSSRGGIRSRLASANAGTNTTKAGAGAAIQAPWRMWEMTRHHCLNQKTRYC